MTKKRHSDGEDKSESEARTGVGVESKDKEKEDPFCLPNWIAKPLSKIF